MVAHAFAVKRRGAEQANVVATDFRGQVFEPGVARE
jgi:hypothetical protein